MSVNVKNSSTVIYCSSIVLALSLVTHCGPTNKSDSTHGCSNVINSKSLIVSDKLEANSNEYHCGDCPWLVGNDCHCADSLDGVIYCDQSGDVFIKFQYCMTLLDGEEIVGRCPYTFVKYSDPDVDNVGLYYKVSSQTTELEHVLCDRLNRRGLLCGTCKEGYGYPMYPNFIQCVECPPNLHARNWVLFVLISFVPLTAFLMLVVCLRINAASAPLNAFVFISQVISQPPFTRGFILTINESFLPNCVKLLLKFLQSLYGFWNLDFFVGMMPHFCLPHQNVFRVITLTYLVAFYPLILLALVYISVEFHSRNFKILVWMWRPFHSLYVRFRRHCDIKASIIDAFATFLLLSYVKILFISFDVLSPTKLMDKNGSYIGLVSYFDASFTVSSNPSVVLTIVSNLLLLVVFIICPAILLLLYPCGFCQKCLTKIKMHTQFLHFLTNSFNGCYKDGTEAVVDRRFFAAIFLIVRILISIECAFIYMYFDYYSAIVITCTAFAVLIVVVQPYSKQYSHFNHLDPLMIFFLIVWLVSYRNIHMAAGKHLKHQNVSVALCIISLIFPLIVILLYVLKGFFVKRCYCIHKYLSSSLEESQELEQRTHHPHIQELDYMSAESVLHENNTIYANENNLHR